MTTNPSKCIQRLDGGCQCSRNITHLIPNSDTKGVCTQHARSYDRPIAKR